MIPFNKQTVNQISSVVYLDCNATTPLEPQVVEQMLIYLKEDFGNAGSRTHEFGVRAKRAVEKARAPIAEMVHAKNDEVIFTSGATESNNLAILGLADYGEQIGRKHIVSTQIEHKAVLEPLQFLKSKGFEITLIPPNTEGWVEADEIAGALRKDTLLVSVMHVNNETGIIQPISDIANCLNGLDIFFHVDAAQGFGKDIETLQNKRIDLISISSHKIYGPKGIGALIARRRNFQRLPIRPLLFGGGQERGLRPGTLPVHLIVGLGTASEIALKEAEERQDQCKYFRKIVMEAIEPLSPQLNGNPNRALPHVINFTINGVDSEALMVALKGLIAISNGSACTSHLYEPSHVLRAMGLDEERIKGAVRVSWCHMSPQPDWKKIVRIIKDLRTAK